jgi:hypothetical protein
MNEMTSYDSIHGTSNFKLFADVWVNLVRRDAEALSG